MQAFPALPDVESAPVGLFNAGHLWVQEWVAGGPLRFQLGGDGLLRFGDGERVFPPGEIPVGYRAAAREVRERLDRGALRDALDDTETATFFGVAPRFEGVDYDWARTPAFLGFDARVEGDFLPPDAVERTFERLGLTPLNAVAKEVRATDFDPGSYDAPVSAWRDGPAAGVLVRNKTGDRAVRRFDTAVEVAPFEGDAEAAAAEFATRERIEAAADEVGSDVDAVAERVVETLARERYAVLFGDDAGVDPAAFQSAVAKRASRVVGGG
ncbi:hypothetical protein [Halobacterium litoreum]|uniref:RNA ligase domain-containing protein n=1 Tax=Halobacterium litoreum TaxID=2039234 RepID=A0ABD5NC69_9EURY|nr:hypothetical protein [Halobacterium litoreum]UHH14534.1 hypothetical protein LT972_05925 [Halobacterium litoreum]